MEKGLTTFDYVKIVFYLAYIGIVIWILQYLFDLEKKHCNCALTWHLNYIKAILIGYIIMIVMGLVLNRVILTSDMEKTTKSSILRVYTIISGIFGIASLVSIGVTLYYIKKLEDEDCKCSEDPARTALKVLTYVQIALLSIAIVVILMIMSIGVSFLSSMKKDKESKSSSTRIVPISTPVSAPIHSVQSVIPSVPGSKSKSKKSKSSKK